MQNTRRGKIVFLFCMHKVIRISGFMYITPIIIEPYPCALLLKHTECMNYVTCLFNDATEATKFLETLEIYVTGLADKYKI